MSEEDDKGERKTPVSNEEKKKLVVPNRRRGKRSESMT